MDVFLFFPASPGLVAIRDNGGPRQPDYVLQHLNGISRPMGVSAL